MQSRRSAGIPITRYLANEHDDSDKIAKDQEIEHPSFRARYDEGPLRVRLFLVLSSISPLFLLWANQGTNAIPEWIFLAGCGLLLVVPNAYLFTFVSRARRNTEPRSITVAQADDRRQDLISYLFAMLLPFYAADLSAGREFAATVVALLFIVVLFISLNLHYMNFIVALFGYHCFQVHTVEVNPRVSSSGVFMVVTKSARLRPGTRITGHIISPTLLIEKSE